MSFLKVYFDFEDRTEMLSEIEQGRLLLTMLRYAQGKTLPELKGNEKYLFPVFKGDIDRDRAAYATKLENGVKGGRPAKPKKTENNLTEPEITEDNRTKPNETEDNRILKNKNKNKTKEQDQEQDQEQDRVPARATRFTPPTVDEVAEYAREKGWEAWQFSPERFVDFYTSKGWNVGNNPMRDWKAAARGWASKQNEPRVRTPSTNPALNYAQRDYTGTQPKPERVYMTFDDDEEGQ